MMKTLIMRTWCASSVLWIAVAIVRCWRYGHTFAEAVDFICKINSVTFGIVGVAATVWALFPDPPKSPAASTPTIYELWSRRRMFFSGSRIGAVRKFIVWGVGTKEEAEGVAPVAEGDGYPGDSRLRSGKPLAVPVPGDQYEVSVCYSSGGGTFRGTCTPSGLEWEFFGAETKPA